ncbi:MAG: ATP-binding cassette domain-containing protein [Burkholderiales bacterium]|nr:ATP-binding cassette domain-containing protein [Burkholderiales bacterium]
MSSRPTQSPSTLSPLLRLARFVTPYKGRLAVAALALVIAASAVLALGQGLKHVIDAGITSGNPTSLNAALAGILTIAAVLSVATYARFYLMMSTGERVIADLRRAVFERILTLSPAFYDATRTGEIVSRLTNDTTQLQMVIGFGFSMFLRNLLMMVGAVALLFVTSPKLAGLVVLGVPATLVPILLLGRRVRRLSRASQDRVADVSAHVDEAIHEIRTVQAYVHEHADNEHFASRVEAARRAGVARVRQKAWLIAAVMLIAFSAVGIILWIGGHDVLAGRLSAGELSAFVFYAGIVASGAGTVSEVWGEIQRAAGASERLLELLDALPDITAPANPTALPARLRGRVTLQRLRFAYPTRPESAALADFSLEIAPGERIALVGPSGAGKSTVMALLLRFYDPQAGHILLDGIDIRQCDPADVRRRIALVPQEPVIFAASVLENVRYGRPQASEREARAALEAAHAAEFVDRLPQGLATELGERGVRLSGGQRQRLSIARALLADREVLLLDEATSALDAASERLVQQALQALMRARTSIAIAHRLSTVREADRIVVIEQGRIHAIGRHDELLRQDGLYARLAELQFLHPLPAAAGA